MDVRSQALPLLLAVAALTTAGSGVAVAGGVRQDQQRERAVAAQERADEAERRAAAARAVVVAKEQQAYRAAVRPLVESVFDHVQPLAEAEAQFDDDANGGFAAYADVSVLPTAGEALAARHRDLRALQAPATLKTAAVRLDEALTRLETGARLYREIPFDADGDTFSDAAVDAEQALEAAILGWETAVNGLYGTDVPAVPLSAQSDAEPARRPLSQGAYVLAVDRVCGKAREADSDAEPPSEPAALAAFARDQGTLLRRTVADLAAVKAPARDVARVESALLAPLRDSAKAADALDDLAAGLTRGDQAAVVRAAAALQTGGEAAERAAKGFRAYGAEACAVFLET